MNALRHIARSVLGAKHCSRPDRLTEKEPVRPGAENRTFADIPDRASLDAALAEISTAILKARRFGYDGKGQARLASVDDAESALEVMAGAPALLRASWISVTRFQSSPHGVLGRGCVFDRRKRP